ncbi:MAG TPA: hypothetical protein VFW64_20040 [Pseudonocardiaceae bacterium]|nr:hypothetical protein [Pseudonocardiaceae bacterium]
MFVVVEGFAAQVRNCPRDSNAPWHRAKQPWVAGCAVHNSVRHRNARLIPAGLLPLGMPGASEVSSSGELSEVFVENAQGARADGASCGSAECAQACGAGGVAAPLE